MRRSAATVLLLVVLLGSCGSDASGGSKRPTTGARLQIVAPTANQTVPSPVHVVLRIIGGTIAPATDTKLAKDRGHVHIRVDGQLVSMNYGLEQDVPGLASGSHSLEAEFVAADHQPFANRVIAAVIFRVP
jgi:hypothetical protein